MLQKCGFGNLNFFEKNYDPYKNGVNHAVKNVASYGNPPPLMTMHDPWILHMHYTVPWAWDKKQSIKQC